MSKSRSFKPWIVLLVLAALAAGGYGYYRRNGDAGSAYLTDTVSRGSIVESVAANGTLNPVVLVSVGTQVSGTAVKVHADFNDTVKEGQVLAELDPAAYAARVRQTRAALDAALASLELARSTAARSKDLYDKGYVARQDLDQSRQGLKSASAQVEQARAQVANAEVDLRNSVIRSPVSGVVVARTVEEGQTVAASFQTPELFRIAGDLRQMLIHTTFAEADIGRIAPGQSARFTVDAYPDKSFQGRVRQVRLNPTTTQNVVTYDVVVDVDNADLALLPGMTAYVNIVLSRAENVLRVPNAALRFRPQAELATETARNGGPRSAAPGAGRGEKRGPTVYLLRQGRPEPVTVRTGASDGRHTAVEAGALKEGETLLIGERAAGKDGPAQLPRMRMF